MFKSSAALHQAPLPLPLLWPPVPKNKHQKNTPNEPSLSDARDDQPQRNPKAAGQALARYLHEKPSREGVVERLAVMAHFGIHTLDLSGQVFSAEAVGLLCEVFTARQDLLGQFIEFNFSDARFDRLWPLLDVLENYPGGFMESLDFTGTGVLATDVSGATNHAPLERADLFRIVAIVCRYSATLFELKLNGQRGLAPDASQRQTTKPIDPSSPMFALACALDRSAVKILELRDCGLWAADVNYLDPQALKLDGPRGGFGFQSIDLRGNDGMFGSFVSPVLQVEMVVGQTTGLACNPSMQALYLPSKALDMLGNDEAVAALTRALEQTASRHLVRLEPFSSSSAERFAGLQQLLRGQPTTGSEVREEPVLAVRKEPMSLAPQKPLPPVPQGPLPQALLEAVGSPVLPDTNTGSEGPDVPEGPLNAAAAGQLAAECLQREDDPGFVRLLDRMRAQSISVLDFSRLCLGGKAVDRLAGILKRTPGILAGRVDALNFSDAELDDLEGLRRLIEVWTAQQGAGIRSLDFSGTRIRSEVMSGVWGYQDLPRAVLFDIVGLAQVSPTLCVLKLNRQTGLADEGRDAAGIDSLFGLIDVLGPTGLETLEIRGCARMFLGEETEPLPEALSRKNASGAKTLARRGPGKAPPAPLSSKTLRYIDLRDNEAGFVGNARQVCRLLIRLVRHLSGFGSLQEVYLPPTAIDAPNRCDDLAFELLFELMESGQPHRFKLQAEALPEKEADISLENMLELLNSVVLRSPIASSSSTDVHTRLCGSLSALCTDLSPRTLDRRCRLIEAIGHEVGRCFQSGSAQGAIKRLLFMAELGIKTLSLTAQTLGAQEMACLAHVLNERPRAFTSFDFSGAEVQGSVLAVTTTLKQQLLKGGDIESLDFSRTTIRVDPSTTSTLSAADLIGISDLVRVCGRLRVLKLDGQPQLSRCKTLRGRLLSTAADWPMTLLVDVLAVGSVERLSLRFCDLKFEDLQLLYLDGLPLDGRRSSLRSIDLSKNSRLFLGAKASKAIRLVKDVIKDAPNLRELHLPVEAIDLFDNDQAIQQLTATLLKLRLTSPLARLEPLSSSDVKRFGVIQELLADNRAHTKT